MRGIQGLNGQAGARSLVTDTACEAVHMRHLDSGSALNWKNMWVDATHPLLAAAVPELAGYEPIHLLPVWHASGAQGRCACALAASHVHVAAEENLTDAAQQDALA